MSGQVAEPAAKRLLDEVTAHLNSYSDEIEDLAWRRYARELEAALPDAPRELQGLLHNAIGSCWMKLGQTSRALTEHRLAAACDPRDAGHKNNIAYDLLLMKRPMDALKQLHAALAMKDVPRHVEVRLRVNEIDAYIQLADGVRAQDALDTALARVEARDEMNLLNLAGLSATLGRDQDVVEMYARFAEITVGSRTLEQSAVDFLQTVASDALSRAEQAVRESVARVVRLQDPVAAALIAAPVEDDLVTPEEAGLITEGREAVARGDSVDTDQLRRDLGLGPHC